MKADLVKTSEKETAFNRILRFMNEGDVVLTSKEEEILARWSFCHKQQLQRKFTEQQIIEKVCYAFKVSEFTARNDIYQAQALYGGSLKSNKKYLLRHHAEGIMLFIERCKTDKSLVHLVPKLMEAYTKAIAALPVEINNDTLPPPVMNFVLVQGQKINANKSYEDALSEADDLIREDEEKEYSEFEDLSYDQHPTTDLPPDS